MGPFDFLCSLSEEGLFRAVTLPTAGLQLLLARKVENLCGAGLHCHSFSSNALHPQIPTCQHLIIDLRPVQNSCETLESSLLPLPCGGVLLYGEST